MALPRVIGFGGCPINNPLAELSRHRHVASIPKLMGYKNYPYALSSGANLQLLAFLRGQMDVPFNVRELTYGDPNYVPNAEQSALVETADLALIEMSTPIEYDYRGFILNVNRFKDIVLNAMRARPELKRPGNFWNAHGLRVADEANRAKYAEALLALLDPKKDEDKFLIDIVENTVAREKKAQEMADDLIALKKALPIPMVLVQHHFSYMPDGRQLSSPADFTENQVQAAKLAGLPLFDPSPLVIEAGVEKAMADDLRHYARDFFYPVGKAYLRFVSDNKLLDGFEFPAEQA